MHQKMKPGKPVVGPYKGPATLILAAVPHMARFEEILGVFIVFAAVRSLFRA